MRRLLSFVVLWSCFAPLGCAEIVRPSPGPDAPGFQLIALDPIVSKAYTEFGIDLFRMQVEEDPGENLFISPTSAAFALAMTYNGAAGETREAMAVTLGVSGTSIEQVNDANAQWLAALNHTGDPKVELALANSIWARESFPFYPAFLDRNRRYYRAEAREIPFNRAALDLINGWVTNETRGKIDTILDEIDENDVMYLINALYFKGEWTYRFDESATHARPFTRLDGSRVDVEMMNQRAELHYFRGADFGMVALPYGNGRFSMVLALPDQGVSLGDFYAKLTAEQWAAWMAALQLMEVGIVLPKFKVESDLRLNEPLKRLGMENAFEPLDADFSEMSPLGREMFIAFVRQKSFVEVDEKGTEAAAVTAVGVRVVCACGPDYPVLEFDRPFFFAIHDNATETILFLGQLLDPT